MNMPDWLGVVLFAFAAILAGVVMFLVYEAHYDCKERGGVLVKTLEGGVCIKGD